MARRGKKRIVKADPMPKEAYAISSGRSNLMQMPPRAANVDPLTAQWLTSLSAFPNDIHPGVGVLTYSQLRSMSRVPYVASIIMTRMNQASDFAFPQPDEFSLGFAVEPVQKGRILTRSDRIAIGEITEMFLNGGDRFFPGGSEAALRQIVHDTLVFDQTNVEPLMDHMTQKPYGYCPADPSTIRRAIPDRKALNDLRWDPGETAYVQIINNRVVREFNRHELSWWIRNQESFIYRYGYGAPELEKATSIVSALINAIIHNTVNYTTGMHSQNIIEAGILGNEDRVSSLERLIASSVSGPRQNRRTPVIQVNPNLQEYLKVHPLGSTNKEMEFSEWINFLKKQLASLFQMDPAEQGDIFGNEGQKQQMNQTSPSERIFASKERGLRPLMRRIARWFNDFLIQPYWPGYRLVFMGFDAQSEEKKLELDLKAVTGFLSPNELRIARGLEPWDDPVSDRPLSALYSNYTQSQIDAQAQMMGMDDPDSFL